MQITHRDTFKIAEEAAVLEGVLEAVQDSIGVDTDLIEYQSVSVQLLAGWTGTVVFEVTNDPSIPTSWVAKTLQTAGTSSLASSTTGAGLFAGDIGARYFRVRSSVFTTGPVPVRIMFSPDSQAAGSAATQAVSLSASTGGPQKNEDAVAANGDAGIFTLGVRQDNPIILASASGDYGAFVIDRHGAQVMRTLDSMKRTYASAVKLSGAAVLAGLILEISGAASTTVEINRLTVTLNGSAAGKMDATLTKRSAVSTGGVAVAAAKVPYDAADVASVATVRTFTTAPTTPGAAIGAIRQAMLANGVNTPSDRLKLESGSYSKSVTLTAAAQALTLELAGTVPAGAELTIDVEWTEF